MDITDFGGFPMSQNLILKKNIPIQAPVAKVWNALIDPEVIKIYLYGTQTISDWKEGSSILFTGVWEGKAYEDRGTILKLERKKYFVTTIGVIFQELRTSPKIIPSLLSN